MFMIYLLKRRLKHPESRVPRQFVEFYFTPSAVLWAFCRARIADSSSANAVNSSSACTLSVIAMCVCNPERSPVGINR
jgi:hypothetical protein